MKSDIKDRYGRALEWLEKIGKGTLEWFEKGTEIEWKSDQSPVTIADKEAELGLRESIAQFFPEDGLLGEEFGDRPGSSGFRWIIDPIDGTRSFTRGIPLWGMLVGLEHHGQMVAGVAHAPAMGKTWHACRGEGAFVGDRRISVSKQTDLAHSQVYYSGLKWFRKAGAEEGFLRLSHDCPQIRGFGDFYGFALVAQGSGEAMIEYGVKSWDIAALFPIVEEAGGKMTDWDGGINLNRSDVVASNGLVHEKTRLYFQGFKA